jgi:hypothetical protein
LSCFRSARHGQAISNHYGERWRAIDQVSSGSIAVGHRSLSHAGVIIFELNSAEAAPSSAEAQYAQPLYDETDLANIASA